MMEPVVRLRGLRKSYGSTVALSHLELDIGPGITALLGPNGAGKTTLLRILATVLDASSGSVQIFGKEAVPSNLSSIRERIGYMPQEPAFYSRFRVGDFIDYFGMLKGIGGAAERRATVQRALALVDLAGVSQVRIYKLSGGMRRRVALAVALLGAPRLLILDEPMVGLDPEQRFRFREVISNAAERCAAILSTHQTEDVAAFAQRVIVLHRGAVRFDGRPEALAKQAAGRVWLTDDRSPSALIAWRTGDGTVRNVGDPPPGARLTEPSIDDGYLLLVGDDSGAVVR